MTTLTMLRNRVLLAGLGLALAAGPAAGQSFNPSSLSAAERAALQSILELEQTNVPRPLPGQGGTVTITRTELEPRICRTFVIARSGGRVQGVGCRTGQQQWSFGGASESPRAPAAGTATAAARPGPTVALGPVPGSLGRATAAAPGREREPAAAVPDARNAPFQPPRPRPRPAATAAATVAVADQPEEEAPDEPPEIPAPRRKPGTAVASAPASTVAAPAPASAAPAPAVVPATSSAAAAPPAAPLATAARAAPAGERLANPPRAPRQRARPVLAAVPEPAVAAPREQVAAAAPRELVAAAAREQTAAAPPEVPRPKRKPGRSPPGRAQPGRARR